MAEPMRFTGLRGTLRHDEPLARYTSWRTGGPADALYVPASRDDLAAFVAQLPPGEPLTVIGLGSNLLVRDGGVRGTVVLMHDTGARIALEGERVFAEAAVASPKLARFAAMHGFADAEFLAGVPGTIGGALAMNAGCYGGETWRHVDEVEVLRRDGTFARRTRGDYRIGYRAVLGADGRSPDGIFTAAWFAFPRGNAELARARIKELLSRRIASQPLGLPNAGSVFRNPEGDHAARLIESCGLKGFEIGGAQVSARHANFIVNAQRRATSADIEGLIAHVQRVVRERTGIALETEVRIVGEPARRGIGKGGA